MLTEKQVMEQTIRNAIKDREASKIRRAKYIEENSIKWLENGEKLVARRKKHRMSIRQVADLLGTSSSRIRRLEIGDPVSMASHLTKCYNLLFDHIELHASLMEIQDNHKWRG